MNSCEKCGDSLPDGAGYCPRCGVDASEASGTTAWLSDSSIDADDEFELRRQGPAKHKQRVALGLGVLLAAGAVTVGLTWRQKATHDTTSSSAVALNAVSLPTVEPELPEWVIITIGRVEVMATSSSGGTWDGPIHEASLLGACKGVSSLAGLLGAPAAAVGGAMKHLGCDLVLGGDQAQSDPQAPDLIVKLRALGTEYRTYIAFDQALRDFEYDFIVPLRSLDDSGIVLEVADADDDGDRSLGSVRLSKEKLVALVGSPFVDLSTRSDALRLLEVRVQPAPADAKYRNVTFDVANGGRALELVPVTAGQRIKLKAAGEYQVGSWHDKVIGPEGYPNGEAREYNLPYPAFRQSPHGAAVALLGQGGSIFPVTVAPCAQFIAPTSGLIWVGLNDSDFSNNSGELKFRVVRRLPTVSQWRTPRAPLPCK